MKQSRNLTTGLLTDEVKTAIRTAYAIQAVPRLTVDWNWNRYTTPTAVNTPDDDDEGFDVEAFPIESIIEPIRPTKGIAKARVGQGVAASSYQRPDDPKFYIGDETDVYKYWTSPYLTDGSGIFPNHTDGLTSARPRVDYPVVVKSNKIVIKTENTWATPSAYTVHIKTTTGGAYGSAIGGANPALDNATGVLTLYYNGTAWVTTKPATLVETDVAGIEFRVTAMGAGRKSDGTVMDYKKRTYSAGSANNGVFSTANTTGANSSLNIIAIEAHLERDLTDRLIDVDDTFDMSEVSQLYPIGTITTNQASVTLSNEDGVFNQENTGSIYYGLLEPNAEFNLEYIFTISGVDHSVQQFKMYAVAPWSGAEGTVSVSLDDASKHLKETKPRALFYEDKPVSELVWRVLDSVGFNDYEIDEEDEVIEHKIPVFWTTGEETVWEVLDDLAKATQTAIYFDAFGTLQVKTRSAAFRDGAVADWTLRGEEDGSELPDILQEGGISFDGELEANKVQVIYKATKWKVGTDGKPAMSKVWEPDGESVVVRSSPLVRDIVDASTHIYLDQKEVKIWPYKSKIQIDGEVIQYEGKQYIYWTGASGGTQNWGNVKSADDQKKFDALTPSDYRHKNHYTGGLKIIERELWNTTKRNHVTSLSGYTTKVIQYNPGGASASYANVRGMKHDKTQSIVTIDTPNNLTTPNHTFFANRTGTGTGYKAYGTRIRFNTDKSSTTQRAGIGFRQSNDEDGYFVEVALTNSLTAADRKGRNEVTIFSRVDDVYHAIGKGEPIAIAPGIWYDLDVYVAPSGDQDRIAVWVNGQKIAETTTGSGTKQGDTAKMSMYARGKTNVSYEYLYGINRDTTREPDDDFGYHDLVYGGIRGGQWEREHVWETRTRWKKIRKKKWAKVQFKYNLYMFDEFSPYVHEIREFDVKFEPNPVQSSYLFSTNEWYAATLEYRADPFGARFIVANMGRNHAILKGEDTLIYGGASKAVNQVFAVLGRDLQISDEEKVEKKNEPAIRARGPIESELSNNWIQTKAMAEALAEWMAKHWSDGVDQLTVETFGNPLIEIGDVVDIEYPLEHMSSATHKYFVVGTKNSFDTGISTTLSLRRIRTATNVT